MLYFHFVVIQTIDLIGGSKVYMHKDKSSKWKTIDAMKELTSCFCQKGLVSNLTFGKLAKERGLRFGK